MMQSARSVDVIFLDAAGTLFQVRGSVGGIYSRVAGHYGIDLDPEKTERAFSAAFRVRSAESLSKHMDADLPSSERNWWFEVVRMVMDGRMSGDILNEYFEEVFELFRTEAAWELYPDTMDSLLSLRSQGYRLGVISNFDSRLLDVLANLGLGGMFERVILSWQVGAAKPDARIFQIALESMKVPASRAVHVGDSPWDDVEGARTAGLRSILLDRSGLYSSWEGGRIETLLALPMML